MLVLVLVKFDRNRNLEMEYITAKVIHNEVISYCIPH